FDPERLGPPELGFLAINIMDDLCDDAEGGILGVEASQQCLEGAGLALMGVFGFKHVESQLPRSGAIAFRCDKLETRLGVNEAANQPGAGDAINLYPLACHPRGSSRWLRRCSRGSTSRFNGSHLCLDSSKQFVSGLTARRSIKIHGDDFCQTTLQPSHNR